MQNRSSKRGYQGLIAVSLRIVKRLKNIIAIGLIIEVLLNCFNLISALDFPWQLNEGNFILSHGYFTKSVLQAYGEISPHFENEYILYEIIIAIVNRIAGWTGLCLFFGFVGFLIYVPCLLAFIRSRGRYFMIHLLIFFLAQLIISMRLAARPELIADVCYIVAGTMLVFLQERSWSGLQTFYFGLIFCIWANVHGSFLIGLVMLGLWYGQFFLFNWKAIFFTRDISWIRPGMAALIGSVLNPDGFFRLEQPFKLHSLLWGQATSLEMWPIMTGIVLWLPLTGTLVALITLIIRLQERRNYWMLITLLILQYSTFISNRYAVFIGLSLLIIIWDDIRNIRKSFSPSFFQLPFALSRLMLYFVLTLRLLFLVIFTFEAKWELVKDHEQSIYSESLVTTDSSFVWLQEHPSKSYILLSTIVAGSWAQMPGQEGIHPLIDSGTHRYSDRVNQLYYYLLFSPEAFKLALSKLNVDTIIIGNFNICWAPVLNSNPDWCLTQIKPDSQLYLRKAHHNVSEDQQLFLQWEQMTRHDFTGYTDISYTSIIRGFKLRPEEESLQMLLATQDVSWVFDPQISYVKDWLKEVPDNLIRDALKNIGDKTDNFSSGLRILFFLRLSEFKQAMKVARQWNPSRLNTAYQSFQELRAEAFISGGEGEPARKILESFWPQPRYSLRWAKLCEQVYVQDPQNMPENARLLANLTENFPWEENVIDSLNQNISGLLIQSP
jgi:hypothetical protein